MLTAKQQAHANKLKAKLANILKSREEREQAQDWEVDYETSGSLVIRYGTEARRQDGVIGLVIWD